jgi:hypothetical protein
MEIEDITASPPFRCSLFRINAFGYNQESPDQETDTVHFAIGNTFDANEEERYITILLNVEMFNGPPPDNTQLGYIRTEFNFHLENFTEFTDQKKKRVLPPPPVLAGTIEYALGGTRGALRSKLQGTPYGGYLLPIANVDAIVQHITDDSGIPCSVTADKSANAVSDQE